MSAPPPGDVAAPRFHGEPPRYLTSPILEGARLRHLFATRHFPGGTARWDPAAPLPGEARTTLARHGIGGEVAFVKQVHGAEVVLTREPGMAGEGDALVTDRPGLPLSVFTADCLPVLIYDPAGRRLAAVHAGWRGTVGSVVGAAVGALVAAGGTPETFVAAVGPSIGPCCYEVDAPVIGPLSAAFPDRWRSWATPKGGGKWMLDLWRANEEQLARAGLDPSRIDNPRLCTACRADLFFSYRRGGGRGRLVAVAAISDGGGQA